MHNGYNFIGLIPARGGSVGIRRKNIKDCNGFPLIYWSIEACKKSEYLDEFYVSTEDKQIAKIASSFDAKVLERPIKLAQNDSHVKDTMKYHIEELGLGDKDIIVLLNPTSPQRIVGNFNVIDYCIEQFNPELYDQAASVYMCTHRPYGTASSANRQQLQEYPYDNANVYIHKTNHLKEGKYWVDNENRRQSIITPSIFNYEVDNIYDFIMVEELLRYIKEKGDDIDLSI